jgi:hypothetical protein
MGDQPPAATYLFYYIQNDRGESQSAPNAARLPPRAPGAKLFLADIHAAFPLTGLGAFQFRFQVLQDKQPLFLDLAGPPESTPVPLVNGNVVCKVLRLDTLRTCAGRAAEEGALLRPRAGVVRPRPAPAPPAASPRAAAAAAAPSPRPAAAGAPLPPMPAMPAMATGGSHHDVPKEVDGEEHIRDTGVEHDIYAKLRAVDASGMRPVRAVGAHVGAAPAALPSVVDADLAGKSDFVKASVMARREEERARVDARVAELAAREEGAAREEAAAAAARGAHEARIKEWGLEAGGAVKPIRILLANLHAALWEGAPWEPVGMAKLVVASKVKVFYLKAVRVVHPDKAAGLGVEKGYIAQQIFHKLEESWRKFVETEG